MAISDQSVGSKHFLQRADIHTSWQSDYLNPDMDRFYDLAFAQIRSRIQPTASTKILDAGCGYCYHTVRLAKSGAQITGVDFSEAALAAARQTVASAGIENQVTLEQGDLTQLRFESATFDAVVSWGVLMHVPELEKALGELARVLKPGGMLVLCENNVYSLDVAVRERTLEIIKRMVGRHRPEITRTVRGKEAWHRSETGGLLVRKTAMKYLSDILLQNGLRLVERTAGQFTEGYTNMPRRFLKRGVYALNEFYFKHIRNPHLAIGNILYFRKAEMA